MEKHFCDLSTCGKEIKEREFSLRLVSSNGSLIKRYGLQFSTRDSGNFAYFEFCTEDCLVLFTKGKIDDARLSSSDYKLSHMELVL
jgi:hypothetical protein